MGVFNHSWLEICHMWLLMVLVYDSMNMKGGTFCQALDEDDDDDKSRCKKYVIYTQNAGEWKHNNNLPCLIKASGSSETSSIQKNLPIHQCHRFESLCTNFTLFLPKFADDSDHAFMETVLKESGFESYQFYFFEEESCSNSVYRSGNQHLLICENKTQDIRHDPSLDSQTDPPNRRVTPIYKARNNGFASDNTTHEIDQFAKSSMLLHVAYALTGVAIFSAFLTLSVCCVSHHKRRKHTLDNGNYDAEFNLTVEEDTPLPPQTEANHARPEPQPVSSKVKFEFNNAIYNTSGLITTVIIQPDENQGGGDSNIPLDHQQNGHCHQNEQVQKVLSKSNKDIDKIGSSTFPSGEYQEFAVELKSKVKRVLSNPTYIDGVIRSPIQARQVPNKSLSSGNLKSLNAITQAAEAPLPKKEMAIKLPKKERTGNYQVDTEQAGKKEEIRIHKSPDGKRVDSPRIEEKYPAIQPRDMSYMYVQLPKEWSQNVPIEEPTVPYASTDVTKTVFNHVSVPKHRTNGQRRIDDDGVYETYDRSNRKINKAV
ncbi:uncharacterized protein [Antedon mediterranea]|uniref:uncharacterized protein isoform X2 n=1 Tax=Antedon mediterranea TaxID=105859 RepID=UPI003AF528E2